MHTYRCHCTFKDTLANSCLMLGNPNPPVKVAVGLDIGHNWFRSVVVITLASHARGRGFEPRRNLVLDVPSCIMTHYVHCAHFHLHSQHDSEVIGSTHHCICAIFKTVSAARFWHCRNPGLNRGPLDLQSNALPTELFRPTKVDKTAERIVRIVFHMHCIYAGMGSSTMTAAHPTRHCRISHMV